MPHRRPSGATLIRGVATALVMAVRRTRAAAERHPHVVDAVFAALLAGVSAQITAETGGTNGYGWVWFVALHLPLAWRRRWPAAVFWAVSGLAFTSVTVGATSASLLLVPMIAGYTLARYRPRRYLWSTLVPLTVFTVGWLRHGGPWWDAVALLGLFAVSVLLGTDRRTRHAYLAELEERARRLEREREQTARLTAAAERARIAREMHDIVAHNLTVMIALTDGAVATTPVEPQRAITMMEQASMTGREALTELRQLVGLLRESERSTLPADPDGVRTPQPGFDDLDGLIDQVRTAGLDVTLTQEGVPGVWSPGAGLAVYRIVQEALTNAVRHAGPHAKAEVVLRYHESRAEVDVADDGGGDRIRSNPGLRSAGHGLTGMAERAFSCGGHLHAGPRPEGGWRVRAHLPFGGHAS